MALDTATAQVRQEKKPQKAAWWALIFLALAQLMVVLDGTIVNLALPRLQTEMGISDSTRSWVVTAYALAFGAFLLLGGRIADFWGRKRTFMVAAAGFAVASFIGNSCRLSRALERGRLRGMVARRKMRVIAIPFADDCQARPGR